MKMRKSRIQFLANQQIDWQAMYQANQNPILDADGNISGYEAAKSHYVLYEDRTDDKTMVATSIFQHN
jgi:LAS superfamily LD-carboxypeptidase LdcB